MPKAPVRSTRTKCELPTAQNAQLKAPVRPEKLVGKGGKMYTVRPAPKRPEKPAGKCRFTGPDGFCTNEAMQGGGFRCFGPTCGGREPLPEETPKAPTRPGRQILRDRYGVEIPVNLTETFRTSPLPDILSCISRARVALRKGLEEKDPAFAAVRQDALVNLNNAYSFVASAEVWCVCRVCQGNGCKACHSRGWQTEEEYKRNPPEMKAD